MLDAKIAVLRQELDEDRFKADKPKPSKQDEDDAFNYAKTIATLRLEAKDL
jgi:hypothetical protein